ncbi:MAG: sulfur carrier protein ThiS [Bryobacteraceae bacterium]|nr:sulfur carrier protein ThiS [Bryobacteraceae bacterium]
MEIILNGQPYTAVAGQSLLDLVRSLELEPERVAIELDGQIVKREQWAQTPLRAGARVELVHFVGGG